MRSAWSERSVVALAALLGVASLAGADPYLALPKPAIAGALLVIAVDVRVEAYAPFNYQNREIDPELYADLGRSLAVALKDAFARQFTELVMTDRDRAEALVYLTVKRSDFTRSSTATASDSFGATRDVRVEATLVFPRARAWQSDPIELVATANISAEGRRFEDATFTSVEGRAIEAGPSAARWVLTVLRAQNSDCGVHLTGT